MAVTLHTSLGDIKLEIFCSEVKKLSFNFLALCASGAYDNTKFHRNQKNFVVQGGTFLTKRRRFLKSIDAHEHTQVIPLELEKVVNRYMVDI